MNTYSSVVFLHVIAAMGLFAALVIEWMSLRLLRRSASYEQGRESMAVWGLVARVGGPATVVALASGIYLAGDQRMESQLGGRRHSHAAGDSDRRSPERSDPKTALQTL
jgi:hypothetical protein